MKKFFLSSVLIPLWIQVAAQQGVAINADGSNPSPTAMLDVQSDNRGFLLPRMTTAQRLAISNPANGLLVYDIDRGIMYQRDGSFWRGLLNTSHWNFSLTRNFLYNTSDSIGIGTATPDAKLELYNGDFLKSMPSTVDNSWIRFNAATSAGAFSKEQGLQFFTNGSNWVGSLRHISSSNNGNQIRISVKHSSSGDLVINDAGQVGIGTQFPDNPLSINGFGIPGTTISISDDADPMIQLKTLGLDRAFLQVDGNDLRMGTNSSNSAGRIVLRNGAVNRLVVDEEGSVGIGTESIAAKLHLNSGASNAAFRIQGDNNPAMQFYIGASSIGSIQAGTNYLSILAPNKLLRLNNNLFIDDASNRVGIGTTDPDQKLHVVGTAKVSTGKVLNNSDENLLPIGYATFNGGNSGTKRAGTANVTGGWIGNDFSLDVPGVDIREASVVITPRNARLFATYRPGPNLGLILNFYDADGDEHAPPFTVVIFKSN